MTIAHQSWKLQQKNKEAAAKAASSFVYPTFIHAFPKTFLKIPTTKNDYTFFAVFYSLLFVISSFRHRNN